jgi:hypothetical protein
MTVSIDPFTGTDSIGVVTTIGSDGPGPGAHGRTAWPPVTVTT